VYRVESVAQVYGAALEAPPPPEVDVTTLRTCMARLSAAADLASLLDNLLDVLADPIGLEHAMVLMHDPVAQRLYTVASRGYAQSGVGAEVRPGDGIIGAAAQSRIPIRISHATSEFGYGRAMREDAERRGVAGLEHEIPFPGLPESQSQIAVPILAGGRLLGVLFAESAATGRFGYDEEDGFMVLASHVGAVAALLEEEAPAPAREQRAPPRAIVSPSGAPLRVRRYAENDSIFVDEEYLIKGVAGAILWRLLRAHVDEGRHDHTNRELRLDPAIRLPDLSENLEARLILLARRLEERCPSLRIEKTGRGRFRFHVLRPVTLAEIVR
jgi:adenylate cyclase